MSDFAYLYLIALEREIIHGTDPGLLRLGGGRTASRGRRDRPRATRTALPRPTSWVGRVATWVHRTA